MNILEMEQQTDEWRNARIGRVTASRVAKVLTEPKGTKDREAGLLSKTAEGLLYELIAEKLAGEHQQSDGSTAIKAMAWGNEHEDTARRVYEEMTGLDVQQVGFIEHDTLAAGCSPDGLVGVKGGLEIKCPFTPAVHVKNLQTREVPVDYKPQVQFSLWVSGREWWDFVSYCPRIPEVELAFSRIRVERDEPFIQSIERKTKRFLEELDQRWNELQPYLDKPSKSETHRIAHLCCDPITLHYKGEVIEIS